MRWNMSNKPEFDMMKAHKYFSAQCFNQAWGLIEKTDRTPEENEEMIQLSQASIWHWTQRDDCTDQNMSIGYWQASRIFAIIGDVVSARKYGEICLSYSKNEPPFYLGYAYEALARAEMVGGDEKKMNEYLSLAKEQLDKVTDPDGKKYLQADLETIK